MPAALTLIMSIETPSSASRPNRTAWSRLRARRAVARAWMMRKNVDLAARRDAGDGALRIGRRARRRSSCRSCSRRAFDRVRRARRVRQLGGLVVHHLRAFGGELDHLAGRRAVDRVRAVDRARIATTSRRSTSVKISTGADPSAAPERDRGQVASAAAERRRRAAVSVTPWKPATTGMMPCSSAATHG